MDIEAYFAVRDRLEDVLTHADGQTPLPTCPDWRIRDVVAHLAGLCEDWVDHRLDAYGSPDWTAAQTARFSNCSIPEIFGRWVAACKNFARLNDDPVMGPPARWAFGDAVTHEADVRGALRAARVPKDAVALALKGSIGRWRQVLADAGAPTLLLRAPDARDWWLGVAQDPGAVVVEAPAYEIFRALTGRRSRHQMGAWAWSGDPGPYLEAGLPYPFRWAAVDIAD